ncbi:MAG: hypothetical protein ACFFCD_15480 [Promethearchaeota archaeon]
MRHKNGSKNEKGIVERIQYKQALMTVIRNFEDVLREHVYKTHGQFPNVIDIRDIDEITRFGATGQVHLVTIDFGSDFGTHQTMLAIKFSSSPQKVFTEAANSRWLFKQLEYYNYGDLCTPQLLFAFPEEKILTYEGIQGKSYYEESIGIKKKAVLAGRLLAAVQGTEVRTLDVEHYENLMALMLLNLPISTLRRESIAKLCAAYFEEMKESRGGGNIFGDYHQANVILSREEHTSYFQKIYVIDPEYMQLNQNYCRSEDIANFFHFQISEEFKQTKAIDETQSALHYFLSGYNQILRDFNLSLKELYPLNMPLEFHLAYHIFTHLRLLIKRSRQTIKRSKKVEKRSVKGLIEEVKELISFTEFLLKERPLTS